MVWAFVEDVMPPYSEARDNGVIGLDVALVVPPDPLGAPVCVVLTLFCAR
jgi:hypothetical protein